MVNIEILLMDMFVSQSCAEHEVRVAV